ncbi:hypothetical protein Tco_0295128 [Tanacetum coccineum]
MLHPNRLNLPSFGRHLEEIHVTWTQFGKKRDKIATLYEDDEELIVRDVPKAAVLAYCYVLLDREANGIQLNTDADDIRCFNTIGKIGFKIPHPACQPRIQRPVLTAFVKHLKKKYVTWAQFEKKRDKNATLQDFDQAMDLQRVETASGFPLTPSKFQGNDVTNFCNDVKCMTKSSTSELFTPYKEPEREFRSSRRHFKTLSLDELRSPDFNLFSDQEYSEEEVAVTMAENMEQYMSKTRADYGSGVASPKLKTRITLN